MRSATTISTVQILGLSRAAPARAPGTRRRAARAPDARGSAADIPTRAADGADIAACRRADRAARSRPDWRATKRQIPVEQKLDLDQQRVDVIGRNRMSDQRRDRERGRKLELVERDEHVDRGLIALFDRSGRISRDDAVIAEILENDESFGEIDRIDLEIGRA